MSGSITAANAVLILTIQGLFSIPQQLQQFSADNIFDTPSQDFVETSMGLDGTLSGGFVFTPTDQTFSLQANSDSNRLFSTWWSAMTTLIDVYEASATVELPSIGLSFACTKGFLVSGPKFPTASKTLQPLKYAVRWGKVQGSPI